MPCIGKWVSDMSEMERLDISKLVGYLREEFQTMYFTKAEEKLRILEEEDEKKKHVEDELRLYKDKCSELFESSEEEMRAYKDKCNELLEQIGKFEATEVELMECRVLCEDLKEKVMYLENVNAEKDWEISELRSNDKGKDDFEFDLEPDMCLAEYMLKVKEASKMKKRIGITGIEIGMGKAKSRKLVEIVSKGFPKQQKRSRRSGGSISGDGKKLSRKRNRDGKAKKESGKGGNNVLLERKMKRMKTNSGALGNRVNVLALKTRSRILEDSKKKNMNRNRQALGKVVGVRTKKRAVEEAVKPMSRGLEESKKNNMKRTSEALDKHADVKRNNRRVGDDTETRSMSLTESKKNNTKRSRTALDKHLIVMAQNGAAEEAVRTRSRSLAESSKRIRKKSRVVLENYVHAQTKNKPVEEAVKAKCVIVDNPGKSGKIISKSDGANAVKNSSSTNARSVGGVSCHQCKTKRTEILSCMNCKRRYCFLCIRNRYPKMSHGEIEKSCPACHGNCNCKACLRKNEKI